MNKSTKFFKYIRLVLIPCVLILICALSFYLYQIHSRYSLIVKFSESGPLYKDMPVYYKGYEIGKAQKIELTPDYKYTLVTIVLYPKNPKLSEDIIAKVKHHNVRKEYIELMNPDQASTVLLKNKSTIDGEPAFDIEVFLSDIADSGLIVPLIQTFSDTLISLDKTSAEIKNFFSDSRLVLKDNRQNLKQTTSSLVQASGAVKKLTSKINKSMSDDKINNTTSRVDKSSANILEATESAKNIAKNIDSATKNLDKTVAKIDCTISEVNKVATNAKVITGGLCEVLHKRFAGIRIIFGKPMKKNNCSKHCSD